MTWLHFVNQLSDNCILVCLSRTDSDKPNKWLLIRRVWCRMSLLRPGVNINSNLIWNLLTMWKKLAKRCKKQCSWYLKVIMFVHWYIKWSCSTFFNMITYIHTFSYRIVCHILLMVCGGALTGLVTFCVVVSWSGVTPVPQADMCSRSVYSCLWVSGRSVTSYHNLVHSLVSSPCSVYCP